MVHRTEAIVLRAIDYGESSQIVTILTSEFGKVTVMARGSRKPRSRFGSALQPMSHVEAVYYFKPTRSVQTLTECAHVLRLFNLSRELNKIAVGLRIIDLAGAMVGDDDPQPELFALTRDTLQTLDRTHERVSHLLPRFELRLAQTLGFEPSLTRAEVESVGVAGGYVVLSDGSVASSRPGSDTPYLSASRAVIRAFGVLALAPDDVVSRMRMDGGTAGEVSHLVTTFLKYHLEQLYPTRAQRVIDALLKFDAK